MEQRSQMLKQMQLSRTEREREVLFLQNLQKKPACAGLSIALCSLLEYIVSVFHKYFTVV